INNWPLDHLAFDQLMTSQRSLASLEGNSSSVVGFHALEYIFFRDGHIRRFSAITERELTYAKHLSDTCG
ncbi:MAG: imelysin, partial [Prevotella sp.]